MWPKWKIIDQDEQITSEEASHVKLSKRSTQRKKDEAIKECHNKEYEHFPHTIKEQNKSQEQQHDSNKSTVPVIFKTLYKVQKQGKQTIVRSIWSTANTFLDITSNHPLPWENRHKIKEMQKLMRYYIVIHRPANIVCSFQLYLENQDLPSARFKEKIKMRNNHLCIR